MNVLFLLLCLTIFSSVAAGEAHLLADNETQDNGEDLAETRVMLAPLNPEFIEYQEQKERKTEILRRTVASGNEASLEFPDGTELMGVTPIPLDLSYMGEISYNNIEDVGVSQGLLYYDLRDQGKVSSIKEQGDADTCWAFATYASMESYLLPKENRDFSENHLKNTLSEIYPEGFDRPHDGGGNHFKATAYLARWDGPVAEKEDTYNLNSGVSPEGLQAKKHIQEVLFLPDRDGPLDNRDIKWALQNYGALYSTMYYSTIYYNSTTHNYYYPGKASPNHAITIVGWNDSFDRNAFPTPAPGDGAFIVKNTWGSEWGDNGYFYISYYDTNIGINNAVFTAETPQNYASIYQYDPLGWVQTTGYENKKSAWGANVFTSQTEEELTAVSFYTTDSNVEYELYIYTNLKQREGPINSAADPVFSKKGTLPTAGYHTVPLEAAVTLKENERFSVVIKFTTLEYTYPVSLEIPIQGWSSKADSNPGESYISSNGRGWDDITEFYSGANVCIKAFTVPIGGLKIKPVSDFTVDDFIGPVPLKVYFRDESTGDPVAWEWNFGDGEISAARNPTHVYSKAGSYTVSLTVRNAVSTDTKIMGNYITVLEAGSFNPMDYDENENNIIEKPEVIKAINDYLEGKIMKDDLKAVLNIYLK